VLLGLLARRIELLFELLNLVGSNGLEGLILAEFGTVLVAVWVYLAVLALPPALGHARDRRLLDRCVDQEPLLLAWLLD